MLLQETSNKTVQWSQATARHSMMQRSTANSKSTQQSQHSTAQPNPAQPSLQMQGLAHCSKAHLPALSTAPSTEILGGHGDNG